MSIRPHSVMTLVIAIALAAALISSLSWPLRASILVLTLGSVGLVLTIVQLSRELKATTADALKSSGMDIELTDNQELHKAPLRALDIWAWLAGFIIAIWLVGFFVAVTLWAFLYSFLHGARWYLALFITLFCLLFLWGLFERIVHVPWPEPFLLYLIGGAASSG